MSVACFIKTVETVENVGDDSYRVSLVCSLMDVSNSQFSVQFDAVKGSDWRIQARAAVSSFALQNLGETVDFVVTPGLETL